MRAAVLLDECLKRGVKIAHADGKLRVSPPGVLPTDLKEALREHKKEVVSLLQSKRPFLPRPLGQEDALDPWEVWTPLFDWLIEHHPDQFHAICDAEDELNRLEREGIISGPQYEIACNRLLTAFEIGRKLKLAHTIQHWTH
jgi:hypothetical protein